MKSNRTKPDRRCEYCREPLTARRVQVYRHRRTRHIVFEGVPALVCLACGHRVFEPEAVEAMEHGLTARVVRRRKAELLIVPT